jgi:hypothetical protein
VTAILSACFSGRHDLAIFPFRNRSAQRDSQTDTGRLQRLHKALSVIRGEMETERLGLRDRYESVMANAAFSQQLVEDDGGSGGISSKVDDMTCTMIRTTTRIAQLQEQIYFVTEMAGSLDTFAHRSAENETVRPLAVVGLPSRRASAGHNAPITDKRVGQRNA